ncbi:MAG: hypothetical protein ABI197_04620 [Granulicella sp.]
MADCSTTDQMAQSLKLSPRTLPPFLIDRKSRPSSMPVAVRQTSIPSFTQIGTATVRTHVLEPEEACQLHIHLQSTLSIPYHRGSFQMVDEPLDEPPVMLRHELAEGCIEATRSRVVGIGQRVRTSS